MSGNRQLHQGKKNKEDEFYTRLPDIEDELKHYKAHFKDKVVYCNCDDPRVSNFFVYFAENFEVLGLKKLITTCYKSDNIDLFSQNNKERAVYLVYEGDTNNNKIVDDEEIEVLPMKGDGDFRSDECIAILKEADIICTNPPFSLFREYVAQLMEYKKDFLIIGNQNAINNKDIFLFIKDNKLWLGNNSGNMQFKVPDYYPPRKSRFWIDENGQKWRSMGNTCWFTNLNIKKRHDRLEPSLYKEYNERDYPKYDNYDAIEVGRKNDIPLDYDGVMGVPITFLEKYNPDEFEILGCTQRGCHDLVPDTKKYDSYREMKPDGTPTGSSGGKTNENANLLQNNGKHNYFTNGEREIQSKYGRIFIRWRK